MLSWRLGAGLALHHAERSPDRKEPQEKRHTARDSIEEQACIAWKCFLILPILPKYTRASRAGAKEERRTQPRKTSKMESQNEDPTNLSFPILVHTRHQPSPILPPATPPPPLLLLLLIIIASLDSPQSAIPHHHPFIALFCAGAVTVVVHVLIATVLVLSLVIVVGTVSRETLVIIRVVVP